MSNLEKVIDAIERCLVNNACRDCAYYDAEHPYIKCVNMLLRDALELLKGQELVNPLLAEHSIFGTNRICSKCKRYLFPGGRYCPHCGAEVKWDA